MKVSDLRTRYLEFFSAHDHMRLPSSPLVPNDSTLLFTSAGMVQFKDYFAGRAAAPHPRVVTCQKCFRTTDIENVGKTAFHQTFFEMLGNFSFGDYFKEGAITLQWQFLTKELGVDPSRLWVSIYLDDDEAFVIWCDVIGLPEDRIVRLGKEHNWWGPVGDSGPCGPDSEIHFDNGLDAGCGSPDCEGPACDCDRFSEMGNLVFMQFNATEDGSLEPLANKNIDTGMGLERIAATLQGVESNFDTDVFRPITEAIESSSGRPLNSDDRIYRNTIADHVRAVVFLLAEGVMPSNERQGYVLRRILRRAIRAGELIGLAPGSLAELVDPVIESMGAAYPEIVSAGDLSQRLIAREEETFRKTLREGERRLGKVLDQLKADGVAVIPGDTVFELNDTYGFPLEMTQEIAADRGFDIDLPGYEAALEQQRIRSRRSVAEAHLDLEVQEAQKGGETQFLGYESLTSNAVVQQAISDFCESGECPLRAIVVDRTPFYAASGGQVADTGLVESLTLPGQISRIVNVVKLPHGPFVHEVEDPSVLFNVGDEVTLTVDGARRDRIRRNHTATHLLHAGLRNVLGSHVKQAGSLVNDEELRFDFSHFEKMTDEQIAAVEDFSNAAVLANEEVRTDLLSLEQATEAGAIGLFDDEYRGKAEVRVVSVGDVSKELCGGTHVSRSGDIGLIKIVSEESIAAGTRRIRAITGDAVMAYLRRQDAFAQSMREELGDDPVVGVSHLRDRVAELSSELESVVVDRLSSLAKELSSSATEHNGTHLIGKRVDLPADQLKQLADLIEASVSPAVIVLAGDFNGRALVVCKVTKGIDAVKAGDVVRTMSKALGGGGGGALTFAQGGGGDVDQIDVVLDNALRDIAAALGG